jgi:GntR family transcriptional repressor for pyruvate dehydrogenase complex
MADLPLRRETLAEQLAERLTALIMAEGLRSGDALPSEAKLAAQFGVSRPIMREALRTLQAQGIIAVTNGKCATVRPLTSDPLSSFFTWAMRFEENALVDLLEVRKGLELQSIMLATERHTPEEIAGMHTTIAAMAAHLHDADAYTELDYELHMQIATAAHNAMLRHLLGSIRELFKETIREGLRRQSADEGRRRIQAGHERIVAAIAAGDGTAAAAAMSRHLDGARTLIALNRYDAEGIEGELHDAAR